MNRLLPFAIALMFSAPLAWAEDKGHDHMAAKNGQAQPHDMAAMSAEEFAKLDADKNGQLARAELPKDHKLTAHFDMLDTDKNGTLSAAEFAKGGSM
jgi:Ca2+-binding EF-hand superfamily protein